MKTIWERLKNYLDSSFPGIELGALRPPATLGQIQAVEAEFGVEFPGELREAYLNFDGVAIDRSWWMRDPIPLRIPALIVNGFDWLRLDELVHRWRTCREVAMSLMPDVGDVSFAPGDVVCSWPCIDPYWVPIGASNDGSMAICDLDPGPAGLRGQILQSSFEGPTSVIADSFGTYVERLVTALEARELIPHLDRNWRWYLKNGQPASSIPDGYVPPGGARA